MDLITAGVAGLGIGVGLVVGTYLLRRLTKYLREEDE